MDRNELLSRSQKVMGNFILSASGWRTVFSASGEEEDASAELQTIHAVLAGLMARVFVEALPGLCGKEAAKCCVALGTDTRPTGPALLVAMLPALIEAGCRIRVAGVSAAPEIMAWSHTDPGIDGFIYISASHNPVGHNGVKFGLDTGGVLNGDQVKPLIARFRELANDGEALSGMARLQVECPASLISEMMALSASWKTAALKAYRDFSTVVIADTWDAAKADGIFETLRQGIRSRPIGIVGDLNGSARTVSIDRDFLTDLGVKTRFINDRPGEIAHRIVPEGHSLDHCRQALLEAYRQEPEFLLGYMPDNDGDRGNLVYVDETEGTASALEAQEVFALCCLAELAFLVHSGQLCYDAAGQATTKVAIAVNDPTSLRIDAIAEAFGARVFRAEVGEANVVNLANQLRQQGWLVRILGEGSNGGNITHPAAVRDPLNTIASILKLLTMTGSSGQPGLFGIWCQRRGISCPSQFGLAGIIATLPAWVTTSAYEDRAILKIRTMDHALLKERYEALFLEAWEKDKHDLAKRFGIMSWEELNYEGTIERAGFGPGFRTGAARGGFRILFRNSESTPVAMIWMRGSGTEPVFRVAAEVSGKDPQSELWLLEWHKALIARADSAS